MALGSIRDIYSQNTLDTEKKLKEVEALKPDEYQSNYGATINELMDKIVNLRDFAYDFNADAMYQQYKDNYTQLGKQASMDTAANVAALTGGFGNSYATTAATQANQQYVNQLNNVIPELYQLAMDKYQLDTNRLYNQLSAVGTQDDREYGRYQDTISNWQSERNYYADQLANSVSNDQYVSNYNQSENQWQQSFDYQKEQDAWSNQFQQSQFDYQKEQDAKAYALQLAAASASNSSGGSSSGGSANDDGTQAGSTSSGYDKALNEALKASPNGDSAVYSELAKRVNSGEITEEDAYEIKEKIDKKASIKNMTKYFN